MDKTLRTIYLKVKSETKTLTKSAIAQILVKIIFSVEHRVSFNEIISLYKNFIGRKQVDETAISEILNTLCLSSEIKKSPTNLYYLIPSRRKEIQECYNESTRRTEKIINKYFSAVNTSQDIVKSWLLDVTLHFFRFFSDEWVSDLLKTNNAVIYSKDSIRLMIDKRTKDIKGIDRNDYDNLPKLFYKFICSKDPDVMAYLWEYGTSAFAAKLISNTTGVDKLTLDVFKDSKCLLDTNILLFIKLESSKYHNALISIEDAFQHLGIKLYILRITKEEFEHKVEHQKNLTINNLIRYGYELTSNAKDDFTQSALNLNCTTEDDFETYFCELQTLPEYLNDSIPIKIIDNEELDKAIAEAQASECKRNDLNTVFHYATGHDKRSTALYHDVGLISCAESLRNKDKWFILSEEISINNYSKSKPTIKGLPLSIKIETIINVLALNNGGDSFDADNYMSLFASIIRNGFQPQSDTYVQEDLYAIYELNQQIALLPEEQKKEIVHDIQSKRLKGESDERIKVELERAITRGKMQITDDLQDTRNELSLTKQDAQRQKNRGDLALQALESQVRKDVEKRFRKDLVKSIAIPLLGIPLLVFLIITIFNCIKQHFDGNGQSIGYVINIIVGLLLDIIYFVFHGCKSLLKKIKTKDEFILKETQKLINKALGYK